MPTSQLLLSLVLLVVGAVLVLYEIRTPRVRAVAGGLGVNVIAAAVVLGIQSVYENKWNVLPFLAGGGISVALTLPFIVYRQRAYRAELNRMTLEKNQMSSAIEADEQERDRLRSENSDASRTIEELRATLQNKSKPVPGDIRSSGLTFYARNYAQHFKPVTGQDFADYVRSFVLSSEPGSQFKIIGIDWTELFGAAVSATSEVYFPLLADRRTSFKVMLLDPRSRVGLEKRVSEFALSPGGKPRYVANHQQRICGKILGAIEMIADYHKTHPQQCVLKLTPELPMVCAVLNGRETIFYPYSRCHKGWDSPVFRAAREPGGMYEFLEEYFDFMWQNPLPSLSDDAWRDEQANLSPTKAHLERILTAACQGPDHAACARMA